MQLLDLVASLKFISDKYSRLLGTLEIFSIQDLLNYIPRTYEDTRTVTFVKDLIEKDKIYTIKVQIDDIKNIRIRGGKSIQKAIVSDESGSINVTWFNQKFLTSTLAIGKSVYLTGKLNPRSIIPDLYAPKYELDQDININLTRIAPVYNLTAGLSLKWLRRRIFELVDQIEKLNISDKLPSEIKEKYQLIDLLLAYKLIHFPENVSELIAARKRLAFDELLDIQIKLLKAKQQRLSLSAPKIKTNSIILKKFLNSLPFNLTESQKKAIEDIQSDFQKSYPMHRLIQGDVGSGKTVVAFAAALEAMSSGFQVIIMAPTTILAEQHYTFAQQFIDSKYKIALITSKSKSQKKLSNLDQPQLIIATHAILHKTELVSPKLGLVIIDEEHKFGVKQRSQLIDFNNQTSLEKAHYLSLTATPIPRSVALTLFGDMIVSNIEKPISRKACQTFLVPNSKKEHSYQWLGEKIAEGGQVYWICPLIEDNPNLEAESVKQVFEKLSAIFPKSIKIELLHGKLANSEKTNILQQFVNNQLQILISTTVIEVGIDVPNANLIVIENADRFGLAQLHQLRGRVGRRNQDSWCLLFSTNTNPDSISRLQYFAKENDGNKIAEYDLNTRGPGEVYGTIQSGLPQLRVARFSNNQLLLETREAADYLLNKLKL